MKKLIINLLIFLLLSITYSFAQKTEFTYSISNELDQEFIIRAKIGNSVIAEETIRAKVGLVPFKFACENEQLKDASISIYSSNDSAEAIFEEDVEEYTLVIETKQTKCSADYTVMDSSLSKSLTKSTICFRREMTNNSEDNSDSNTQSIEINLFIEDIGKGIFFETQANATPEILLNPSNENETASTEPKLEIYYNGQKSEL